jgi:anti-sigma regulatory factor (Ser/Thr protein kinase)
MRSRKSFSKSAGSVSDARRFARDALRGLPGEVLELVELMVSELATNCIRHSKTAFEVVVLRRADAIRIEVSDEAGGTPRVRSPAPEDPTGRGLKIVELLSDAWGVEYRAGDGKTVWFAVNAAAHSLA